MSYSLLINHLFTENIDNEVDQALLPNQRQIDNIEQHLRQLDPDYDHIMNGAAVANHGANFNVDGELSRYNKKHVI